MNNYIITTNKKMWWLKYQVQYRGAIKAAHLGPMPMLIPNISKLSGHKYNF